MVKRLPSLRIILMLIAIVIYPFPVRAQQAGSIRGMVYDKDFDAPLAAAQVLIAETNQKVTTTDEGNFVFGQVEPGTYTLVFSKDGYVRQIKANVVVPEGMMTEIDAWLSGEFTEMEEFVVQDVQIGTGTEAALLDLRMESPALMDSISSELMSQAGASDAASALKLVAGATVQDGKYAVVRGLPDRYVNSQMNGVRLPTADADKRAVQLDQFPSAVIESIQVSKTFTPDQQGDASGGAVNVVLKGIPDERILKLESGISFNTQDAGSDFLSYKGGGVSTWGREDRSIPRDPGGFDSTLGVSSDSASQDYKWSIALGDKFDFKDFKIGAFGSFFYERKSSFYDNGIDDQYWVETPGGSMVPQYSQGQPDIGWNPADPYNPPITEDFVTSLFDVTNGTQNVKWGGLGALGFETENHSLNFIYMYTRDATDKAILAENTRGKEYYFPGYDRNDPTHPGNNEQGRFSSPYIRLETLEYTERTTETFQLSGKHKFDLPELKVKNYITFLSPELDWTVAKSTATLEQPDKRLFGSVWYAKGQNSRKPSRIYEETFGKYTPSVNVNLGNVQRIWKSISENSDQYFLNLKFPFEQWSGDEGYLKFGIFNDKVKRNFEQDTFSNPSDGVPDYSAPWEQFWSEIHPSDTVKESLIDIDYCGDQEISAWYYMADIPLNSFFKVIGGVRFETTDLSIKNFPDTDQNGNVTATWFDPAGDRTPFKVQTGKTFPDGPDVMFSQKDKLPSIGFEFQPWEKLVLRGSYSETVARQTFKELTPIVQQEYLGGPIFIGNPGLQMSALKNYDLRLDYTPYDGGLFSFSYFRKDIKDPIEYVQGNAGYTFTYPINYPKGKLSGFEIETRQQLGHFWKSLKGLSIGANATFIRSEVTLPEDQAQDLITLKAPESTRDMTNTPEYLYNLFLNYNMASLGLPDTEFSLFYTVRGDTLIAGASESKGKYIPSVYETEYGTLNLGLSHKFGDTWKLNFMAKNLLNPKIESVYRSDYISGDVTKTSYRKGMDFSISLTARF